MDFLKELRRNNDRDWFEANKQRYKAADEQFKAFTAQLIEGVGRFDPQVRDSRLAVKDCTYRIYRDVRFSHNKDPYKTYMGAYVCRGGKKSGFAGYYFHLEPTGSGSMAGGCFLSSGIIMATPAELKSIRQEISDNGSAFVDAVKSARGFNISEENKLKRVPAGFSADDPYAEYLKLKDVYLMMPLDEKTIFGPDLLQRTLEAFESTCRFDAILNRAVEYAREQM